jgi:hypothetical protein
MKIEVDIDGVLTREIDYRGDGTYLTRTPVDKQIDRINTIAKNSTIILHSARFEIDRKETIQWLNNNSVRYNQLMLDKMQADVRIDDRSLPEVPEAALLANIRCKKNCHFCIWCGEETKEECPICGGKFCTVCGRCFCNAPLLSVLTYRRIIHLGGRTELLNGFVDINVIRSMEKNKLWCQQNR